jgi:hypothetical protein
MSWQQQQQQPFYAAARHPRFANEEAENDDDEDDDDDDDRKSTSSLAFLEEIEISHAQAMQSFLTNDKYADIELQGSDGVLVRANRAMLAARSPMLDRMLYGDFAERTRQTVTVSYTTGEILAAIVQYVYRDECDIFRRPLASPPATPTATTPTASTARGAAAAGSLQQQPQPPLNGQGTDVNAHSSALTASAAATSTTTAALADSTTIQLEWIRTIVAVFDAAKYFLLPGLCRKASTLAQSIMEDQPATAGVFFAACEAFREGASDLEHLALSIIARNPKLALLTPQPPPSLRRRSTMVIPIHGNDIHGSGGAPAADAEEEEEEDAHTTMALKNIRYNRHAFRCMSSTQLQKLLMYPYLQTDEATRFLILHSWANALDNTNSPDEPATLAAQSNKRCRRHHQVTAAACDNESGNMKNHVEDHDLDETKNNGTNDDHENDDNEDDEQEQQQDEVEREQRRRQAKQLTEHLHLERIDAIQLSSVVSFSGLVSTEQFCHAYQTQALLAAYLKPGALSWKSSGDVVFDCQSPSNHSVELLHCRELRTGIHKWSIKLECTGGNDQYLGVAACSCSSSSPPLIQNYIQNNGNGGDGNDGGAAEDGANNNNHDPYRIDPNQWLGSQVSGWVYGSNGSACHAMGHNNYYYGDRRPVFDQGSIITFVLDLTPCSLSSSVSVSTSSSMGTLGTPSSPTRRRGVGAIGGSSGGGGGTLSASVGGLPTCLLFSNMLAELPPDYGFVPAISLRKPGRVRFLGFDVTS